MMNKLLKPVLQILILSAASVLACACGKNCGGQNSVTASASEKSETLNGDWKLSYAEQPYEAARTPDAFRSLKGVKTIPAKVPGAAQLDLQRAGIEPDAMIGDNVYKYRKYESHQWMFSRNFKSPALKEGQRAVLNFQGIDTLADVFVNGKLVGSPENMFIEHKFDITSLLNKNGKNTLDVIIRSAPVESKKYNPIFGGGSFERSEYLHIRKAPSGFGWDIHPRLVTSGLWRDVSLDIHNPVRIEDVYCYTSSVSGKDKTANVGVDIKIDAPYSQLDNLNVKVVFSKDGKIVKTEMLPVYTYLTRIHSRLKNIELWWPRGYGAQPLYDVTVQILDKNKKLLAEKSKKVGIRTVRLDFKELELPQGKGLKMAGGGNLSGDVEKGSVKGDFRFYVNDVPIFMKGTNWVPLDAYHSRDKQHVKGAVEMLADLNCNMIRCWGGNVYEDHEFFDLCDKYGILVWQDFAMGCSVYPQNSEFAKRIEQEVAAVVMKLRSHASVALWAGNNENDQAYSWRPVKMNTAHDRISRFTIPNTIYEYDWTRPYIPSSPYLSAITIAEPTKYAAPEVHLWGARGYYKMPFYNKALAPFVSEIGYHGCPNRGSIEKMMSKKCVYPWNKDGKWNREWQAKATMAFPNGKTETLRNSLMTKQAKILFGEVPTDLDDFILASQIMQAEAKKYFIEVWRSQKFDPKTGILWWNLRDGWPILSDAIVDYYGSKKLAYKYIKRVQKDVCVMITDNFDVVAVNDTGKPANVKVEVCDLSSGEKLFAGDCELAANSKKEVGKIGKPSGQGVMLIKYSVGGGAAEYNHYLYGEPPFKLKEYKKWLKKMDMQ